MKRVVMVTPNFYPHLGGAEKQALELSCALAARGAKVRVLTRRRPGLAAEGSVRGIPVRRLPAFGGGLVDSALFLVGVFLWLVIHARSYDAVHVHLAGSPAVAAALAARLLGKKVVVKVGGGRGIGEVAVSSRTPAGRLKLALLGALHPTFVCVAEDLRAELREYGLGADALQVPNGVDLRAYAPAPPAEKEALRRVLGWKGLVFLYTGRLSVEKRLPEFLASFAAARAAVGGEALVVLVGAGPEEHRIHAEAARLHLEDCLRVAGPSDEIAHFLRAADVFILPSVSEGLSNALLEAMSCALAVLASRVGGTREAVEEGRSGLLFDPMRSAEERAQIERLLRDPALAAKLGAEARRTAEERFSMDAVAERCLALY
ncbi:MAG: glycosyltransferase family 4 protein [Elusimicrobiota bacterium]|jgi:glycosyltransferase involved in cell wall biosynthesis